MYVRNAKSLSNILNVTDPDMSYPVIQLKAGRDQSVQRKHPWIFSRGIHTSTKGISDGSLVHVSNAAGVIIGTGHFQDSSLCIRLLSFEKEKVDALFWKRRIGEAAVFRQDLGFINGHENNAFRLIHGEGDGLPGLIIDVYGDTAVVQAHSIGMFHALEQITHALLSLSTFSIKRVYNKSKDTLPQQFSLKTENGWLGGDPVETQTAFEGGIAFEIDFIQGQKTGFFLDQRNNREWVRHYAKGKTVLNCYCYTGGFSLYALSGNARQVISVDSSALALENLERNLSHLPGEYAHSKIKEDVISYLTNSDELFDLVIIDPPAFAKSIAKRHTAVQAYKRLNILAMKRVKPGGMLFTFSCSQVVDKPLFHHTVVSAAIESGRQVRWMHDLGQGPDHPTSLFHPEGSYLKGMALYLV